MPTQQPVKMSREEFRQKLMGGQSPSQPPEPGIAQQAVSGLGSDAITRATKVGGILKNKNLNPLEKGAQTLGQGFGLANDVFTRGAETVLKTADKATGGALGAAGQAIADSPIGQLGMKAIEAGSEAWGDFKERYPDAAANLEPIAQGAGLALNVATLGGAKNLAQKGITLAKDVKKAQETARVGAVVNSLEQKYQELAGTTMKTKNFLTKSQKATEAKNAAGTTGKSPERILAEAGVVPEQEGTRLNTVRQAESFKKDTGYLNDALGDAIKTIQYGTEPIPVNALESSALSRVMNQALPEGDKVSLAKGIKSEFALLRKKYGDALTVNEMHEAKPAYWGGTKFDSTKPFQGDAYYQVGKSLQKGVEDAAKKGGFEDVAQLNREIGDRLEAARFLEKLDGKVLKHGAIGKHFIRLAGTVAGATTGPLGALLGHFGGDAVANILISNAVMGPTKRLILKRIQQADPAVYKKTVDFLEKQGLLKDAQLKLPPPSSIRLGPGGSPKLDDSGMIQSSTIGPTSQFNPKIALPEAKAGTISGPTQKLGPTYTQEAGVSISSVPKELESLAAEARKYKSAEEFYKAQTDPLLELKKLGPVKDGIGAGTVKEAINDIGGIGNVRRGRVDINKLETTETINTNSTRYKAVEADAKNGNITPIITDEYLRIMDGHHRLKAYKAMGMKEIPVIVPKETTGVKFQTKSQLTNLYNKVMGKK